MALFAVEKELHYRGIQVVFLGSYVWRMQDNTRGRGGRAGFDSARFDSLGLFCVKKVRWVTRFITLPAILRTDDKVKLHVFREAQGYPCSSYLGDRPAIEEYCKEHVHTHGDDEDAAAEEPLPCIRQRILDPEMWDAPGELAAHGAHMPLLFFVGDRTHRTNESLTAREIRMTARGWGPSSENRRWHMTYVQGKGKGKGTRHWQGDGEGMFKDKNKQGFHPW